MTRPLRVLHIVETLGRGGAERQLVSLLAAHDRTAVQPEVVALHAPYDLADELAQAGVPLHRLDLRAHSSVLAALARLHWILRAAPVDVVHTWLTWPDLYGRIAARLWSHAAVVSAVQAPIYEPAVFHDNPGLSRGKYLLTRELDRWTGVWSKAHYVACSDFVARSVEKRLGRRRVNVSTIYNAVPTQTARPCREKARAELGVAGRIVLLNVARLDPQKGQRYLIQSFARVQRACPQAHLLIAGAGPLHRELAAQIRALDLEPHATLLGRRSDVAQLMAASDLFVLPSLWEGLPLAALEALSYGLPIVGSNIPPLAEIVEHGAQGLLVTPRDEPALAAAILDLLADQERRQAMGEAGRRRVVERFTIELAARQTEALYRRLQEVRR